MATNTAAMVDYTTAIKNLPEEAFLGSLLYFSISQADVNLIKARHDLEDAGLSTDTLRKTLRPVDAFRKASRRFGHKFKLEDDVRSELMVRPVGEDGEQAYRHLILERVRMEAGRKRRVFYEKVGEVTFTRGRKIEGEYQGDGVESRRTFGDQLRPIEDQWLSEQLDAFPDFYDHLCHYMDSHAVRTFVREYIYNLSGVCVKESGGLYFIKQEHAEEISRLATWVRSVGSEFHTLPLLNLTDQREMIMEALETDTIAEVGRLMTEIAKILSDPDRKIEEKTYEAYALQAAELAAKVKDYDNMLGSKAQRATIELEMFGQQILSLGSRIRQSSTTRARLSPV